MSDLIGELDRCRREYLQCARNLPELGRKWAQAEANYYRTKNVRALAMSDRGVPATLIQQTIKGDAQVNVDYFDRLCAEIDYKSEIELVNALKLSARLLEEQVKREWGQQGGVM